MEENTNETSIQEKISREMTIPFNYGINESNLMVLPFISLKRKKVLEINNEWYRGDKKIGLKVKGSTHGVPTIYELDVLLGLLRLHLRNQQNRIVLTKTGINTTTNIPKVIHFTYKKLAEELNITYGGATKLRLQQAIECMNEATIYSSLSFYNAETKEYVVRMSETKSSRILKNYTLYSKEEYKLMDYNLLAPTKIEDIQTVEIDDFFFNNLYNSFFKVYDYVVYISLRQSISKRLFLIISQWCNNKQNKFLKIETIYNYLGLKYYPTEKYYYSRIRSALKELKEKTIICDYRLTREGIELSFKSDAIETMKYKRLFRTDNEAIGKLMEVGVDYNVITKYCNNNTLPYIKALLRYYTHKKDKGEVKNDKAFILGGLQYNKYKVDKYL